MTMGYSQRVWNDFLPSRLGVGRVCFSAVDDLVAASKSNKGHVAESSSL